VSSPFGPLSEPGSPASSPSSGSSLASSSSRPPASPASRLSGDDLLAELFDACGDLQFLRDAFEGADFILALTLEKLPSEVGIVSFFDVNSREFVVVRQTGGGDSALLRRLPERSPIVQAAMRTSRAVVVADAMADPHASSDERFQAMRVTPRSLVCAPVQVGGRYLGLIEVINPRDGGRFTEGDGNALTYIGEQFAEFVVERDLTIDPARVGPESFKGQRA
jgi:GAF domain-containing protein